MKASIAFSIFVGPNSPLYGVSGQLELPLIPVVGDEMHFLNSSVSAELPATSFFGVMEIEARSIIVGHACPVHLHLRPIILSSIAEADLIARFFEEGHGLVAIRSDGLQVENEEI